NLAANNTELTADNFDAAVEAMASLVNHKGEPLDINPTIIVVGPQNYSNARNIFEVASLATGGDNPTYQSVRVVREPYITDTSWYLFDTSKALKPFIKQEADDLEL